MSVDNPIAVPCSNLKPPTVEGCTKPSALCSLLKDLDAEVENLHNELNRLNIVLEVVSLPPEPEAGPVQEPTFPIINTELGLRIAATCKSINAAGHAVGNMISRVQL